MVGEVHIPQVSLGYEQLPRLWLGFCCCLSCIREEIRMVVGKGQVTLSATTLISVKKKIIITSSL